MALCFVFWDERPLLGDRDLAAGEERQKFAIGEAQQFGPFADGDALLAEKVQHHGFLHFSRGRGLVYPKVLD